MSKDKNPFEVLGLSKNIVRVLSDTDLELMIKSSYRTLQKLYHPDVGSRRKEKSAELNKAYNTIGPQRKKGDTDDYQYYKERFTKKTQASVKYEEQIGELRKHAQHLENTLVDYMLSSTQHDSELSVMTPKNLTIKIRRIGLSEITRNLQIKADEKQKQLDAKRRMVAEQIRKAKQIQSSIRAIEKKDASKHRKHENNKIRNVLHKASKLKDQANKMDREIPLIEELTNDIPQFVRYCQSILDHALQCLGDIAGLSSVAQEDAVIKLSLSGHLSEVLILGDAQQKQVTDFDEKCGDASGRNSTSERIASKGKKFVRDMKKLAAQNRLNAPKKRSNATDLLSVIPNNYEEIQTLQREQASNSQIKICQLQAELSRVEKKIAESEDKINRYNKECEKSKIQLDDSRFQTLYVMMGDIIVHHQHNGNVSNRRRMVGVIPEEVAQNIGGYNKLLTKLCLTADYRGASSFLLRGRTTSNINSITTNDEFHIEENKFAMLTSMVTPYLTTGGYLLTADPNIDRHLIIEGVIVDVQML